MNVGVIIGLAGALAGLLLATFSLGMSRVSAQRELRLFALVSATAAGYCGFDLALVVNLSPSLTGRLVQVALGFGSLHGVAWIHYLAAASRRPLRRIERWMSASGVVLAVSSLIPGLIIGKEIVTTRLEWLGVTYRTPQPTPVAVAAFSYFGIALVVLAIGAWRPWREGLQARFPLLGVITIGLLTVNDSLAASGVIRMPYLLDGGAVLVVVVTGLLHQRRFAADVKRLELSSTRLEEEVANRSRDLLATQAALARAERMAGLGRLAAGVAHEINNPTAVIQHNLELLHWTGTGTGTEARDTGLSPDTQVHIERSLAATHRIGRIVRQLLDAGRATSLEPSRLEAFAIAPVVRQAVDMTARAVGDFEIDVRVEEPLAARGDAGMVEQVLMNLLANAVYSIRQRDAPGRIAILAERRADRAFISVRDNGTGIPATVRDHLFEPFVTTKPVGKGSGLGLAVSHGLMRSQQGQLRLVHSTDAGTEMAIDLAWSALEAAVPISRPTTQAPEARLDIRVLIIDDDDELREILGQTAALCFRVDVAASIDEAIERIAEAPPVDVVVCDLMMPDGGAETWLLRCRDHAPLLVERTIFITGGPTTPQAVALVEARRDRILFKPFGLADLRAMVLHVARQARRADAAGDR